MYWKHHNIEEKQDDIYSLGIPYYGIKFLVVLAYLIESYCIIKVGGKYSNLTKERILSMNFSMNSREGETSINFVVIGYIIDILINFACIYQ